MLTGWIFKPIHRKLYNIFNLTSFNGDLTKFDNIRVKKMSKIFLSINSHMKKENLTPEKLTQSKNYKFLRAEEKYINTFNSSLMSRIFLFYIGMQLIKRKGGLSYCVERSIPILTSNEEFFEEIKKYLYPMEKLKEKKAHQLFWSDYYETIYDKLPEKERQDIFRSSNEINNSIDTFPLYLMIKNQNKEKVRLFLDALPKDLTKSSLSYSACSLLTEAVKKNNIETVELLVQENRFNFHDSSNSNEESLNPLELACKLGHKEIIDPLLKIFNPCDNKNYALRLAAMSSNKEL